MHYMILDSAGNALLSVEDELTARATMHAMVAIEPEAADHVALLAYGDDGIPVGDAVSPLDSAPAVSVLPSYYLQPTATDVLIRQPRKNATRYVLGTMGWTPRVTAVPA
jgi:hypothetical protein